MSVPRLVFLCLLVSTGMLCAQGQAYSEAKRMEDAALERVRRMKEAKEAARYEPTPRDLAPPKPLPSAALKSRALEPTPEPFRFQVVTPQGLVPLEQWQAAQNPQQAASKVARTEARPASGSPAPEAKPQAKPEPDRNRTIRLAFLGVGNGREKAPGEGRAVSLGAEVEPTGGTVKSAAAPPPKNSTRGEAAVLAARPGTKANVQPKAKAEVAPVTAPVQAPKPAPSAPAPAAVPAPVVASSTEVSPAEDVVAVMEEIPSPKPGGETKRRLLGFLSGKGLEAALMASTGPELSESEPPGPAKSDRPPEKRKPAAAETSLVEAPTVEPPPSEKMPEAKGPGPEREAFLNGIGQWLSTVRAEALKAAPAEARPPEVASLSAKSKPEAKPEAKPERKAEAKPPVDKAAPPAPESAGYFVIKTSKAPFHVVDTGPGETHSMELESGTVGRKHGEGEEWAWMQLDSGLMGLVKKRHLRPAAVGEVVTFLAAESKSGSKSGNGGREVRYLEVELPELPSEMPKRGDAMENPLFASEPAMTTAPEGEASAKEEPTPGIPASGAAPRTSGPQSIPLQGSGPAGALAVPSPVPILP
ncbi:MAG: hypothetical protein DVB23_000416 [Verrucomicrobia bacterium]|nr:MAG: hypothetical protein DVB23_000416 [Verrucomicrobiota bacterium]